MSLKWWSSNSGEVEKGHWAERSVPVRATALGCCRRSATVMWPTKGIKKANSSFWFPSFFNVCCYTTKTHGNIPY